jgi:hypothetical protein
MQYVWMQYPKPTNTVGVDVTITVIDPNNNMYTVASATSDDKGFYSCSFVPEVSGQYKIIASFGGSKSFWGSSDETAIMVSDAPQATTAPVEKEPTAVELYFVPAVIGIIVAIVIVGLVMVLMLRKRP